MHTESQSTAPAPPSIPAAMPMELTYAPPARSHNRGVWVVIAGLATTVLTLAGVSYSRRNGGENMMGWYANYIIPIGAVLVGMFSASGYALASWKLGVKIRRGLLATILGLMLISYFAAEYIEFRAQGPLGVPNGTTTINTPTGRQTVTNYRPLGFWEYFHLRAVNWTWKKQNSYDKSDGEPLGMSGYFFVLLGIVGFTLSGWILPLTLYAKPYCDLCERYMKNKPLAVWPASSSRKVSKKDPEAQAALARENDQMLSGVSLRYENLIALARGSQFDAFRTEVSQDKRARKKAGKALRRLEVNLISCPSCASGWIQGAWLTGQGKQLRRAELPKVELSQSVVRGIV